MDLEIIYTSFPAHDVKSEIGSRLKVPGGWIVYRDVEIEKDDEENVINLFNSTAVFVSDPNHTWIVPDV